MRRALTILSVALLCLSLVQWGRAHYRQGFNNSIVLSDRGFFFNSDSRRLLIGTSWGWKDGSLSANTVSIVGTNGTLVDLLGVTVQHWHGTATDGRTTVPLGQITLMYPPALAVALTAVLPVWELARWRRAHGRRARRERRGLCVACGYDLRASQPFGRCPECGVDIAPRGSLADAQQNDKVPARFPEFFDQSRMNTRYYSAGRAFGKFVFFCTMNLHLVRPELAEREGGYILALTHLGNIDPFASCVLMRRRIRWMTRKEFFRVRPIAWLLNKCGCFSVNRQGIPVSSIRLAIDLAKAGEVVGICPEGGRTRGSEAAIRGAVIKKGVCSVAIRSGRPVVPCVMLGTHDLNRVAPWLPGRWSNLWVAYGEPLEPPPGKSTRAKREAMREQLMAAYVRLYEELRHQFQLEDAAVG
jgi:1-acyl-sn-glycerol-3-phosphate acyltransferase